MNEKTVEAKGVIVQPDAPAAPAAPTVQDSNRFAAAADKLAAAAKPATTPDAVEQPDPLLVRILSTRRAHGSEGDTAFRLWLFSYIKTTLKLNPTAVEPGNIVVDIGSKSTVIFSCHVDTVHGSLESAGGAQKIAFDPNFEHIFLSSENKPQAGCLGADDGVGIYLMLKMLESKVPGRYIFHVGEECGGIGSKAYVSKYAALLESNFEQVVAFDRRVEDGESGEVVITQGGTRCASDEYGKALAAALNAFPFEKPYVISHKGSFTDSKVYREHVPECVNVGCFYNRQHTAQEVVYWKELKVLVEAVCKLDWAKLPIVRKAVKEPVQPRHSHSGNSAYYDDMFNGGGVYGGSGFKQPNKPQSKPTMPPPKKTSGSAFSAREPSITLYDELASGELTMEDLATITGDDDVTKLVVKLWAKLQAAETHIKTLERMLDM